MRESPKVVRYLIFLFNFCPWENEGVTWSYVISYSVHFTAKPVFNPSLSFSLWLIFPYLHTQSMWAAVKVSLLNSEHSRQVTAFSHLEYRWIFCLFCLLLITTLWVFLPLDCLFSLEYLSCCRGKYGPC